MERPATFVASSSNYTAIYSGFAILFFFMIWLYVAWFILLTGSQVAFYLQHPKLVTYGGEHYELSPRLREKVGMSLMTRIAKRFYEQAPALTVNELEAETALTNTVLQDLLLKLERGGLLVEIMGDETCYQPAQDIASIKVSEILTCLRTAEESDSLVIRLDVSSKVEQLLNRLEVAQQSALEDLSLRDLVTRSD